MNVTLEAVGVTFIAAAIIGGGVEAFGIKLPILNSIKRQVMLASFGVLLLILGFVLEAPETPRSQDSMREKMSTERSIHLTLASVMPDDLSLLPACSLTGEGKEMVPETRVKMINR
ncbi:MAG TPA: hypothetical protein VJP02_01160 [Candidatus Sulfotelmatobacter sp.]|nr:hypothetical protein [Candidatus Sulfotelmatobacter sp.]